MDSSQSNNSSNQSQRNSTTVGIRQLISNPEFSKISSSQGTQIQNNFNPSMINLSVQNQMKYISPKAQGIPYAIQQQSQPLTKEPLGKKIRSKIQRNELQLNKEFKITSHQQGNVNVNNNSASLRHSYRNMPQLIPTQKHSISPCQNNLYLSQTRMSQESQFKVLNHEHHANTPQSPQQYKQEQITQKQQKSVDSTTRNPNYDIQQQQYKQHDFQQLSSSLSISSNKKNPNLRDLVSNKSFKCQTPQQIQCKLPEAIKSESIRTCLDKQSMEIDISQDSSLIIIDSQQSAYLPNSSYQPNNNILTNSTQLQPISTSSQTKQFNNTIQQHVKVSIKPCLIQPSFSVKNQNNRIQNELNSFTKSYGTHLPMNQPSLAVLGDTSAHHSCFESTTEDKLKSVGMSSRNLDNCCNFKSQGITSAFNSGEFQDKNEEIGASKKDEIDQKKDQQQEPRNVDEFIVGNYTEKGADCMVPGSPQQYGNQAPDEFQITKTEEEEDSDDNHDQGQQRQLKKIDIPFDSINVHLHFHDLESSSKLCKLETKNNLKSNYNVKLDSFQVDQIQLDLAQPLSQIIQSTRSQNTIISSPNIQKSLSVSQKIKQFRDHQQMKNDPNNNSSGSSNYNSNKPLEEDSKSPCQILNKMHNSIKHSGKKNLRELSLLEDFDNDFEGNTQTLDSREEVTELADSPREFARDQISFGPEKRFLTDACGQEDIEGIILPTEDAKTQKINAQIQSNSSLSFSSTAKKHHITTKNSTTSQPQDVACNNQLLQQQKQIFTSVDSYQLNNSNLLHRIDAQQLQVSSNLDNNDIIYFKYDKATGTLIPLTQDYINLLKDQAVNRNQEQQLQQSRQRQNNSSSWSCQQATRSLNVQTNHSNNTKINYFLQNFNKNQEQHSYQQKQIYTNYSQQISMSHGSTAATSKRHSFQQPQSAITQYQDQQYGNSKSSHPYFKQKQDRNLTEDVHKIAKNPGESIRAFSINPNRNQSSARSIADKYLFNQTRCHLYTEVLDNYQQLFGKKTKGQQKQQREQLQQQMVFTRGRQAQK